jgi:hypothetical protein
MPFCTSPADRSLWRFANRRKPLRSIPAPAQEHLCGQGVQHSGESKRISFLGCHSHTAMTDCWWEGDFPPVIGGRVTGKCYAVDRR